uniref:Ubiquitin-like domain-containing protein n=1 Tax=Panagrolaimus sp. PS1159 TaxID=55785 RepID=A0AC35F6N0_9BILA
MDEMDIGYGPEFVIQNYDGDTMTGQINKTYSIGKLRTLMKENALIPFDRQRYVCSDKNTILDDFIEDDPVAIDSTLQNEDTTTVITTSVDIPAVVETNESCCRDLVTESPQKNYIYITFTKKDGKDFIILVKENNTIESMMLRIQEHSGIPLSRQIFTCYDVRILSDQFLEEEYKRFNASIQEVFNDMKLIRDVISRIPFNVSSDYVPRSDFSNLERESGYYSRDYNATVNSTLIGTEVARDSHVLLSSTLSHSLNLTTLNDGDCENDHVQHVMDDLLNQLQTSDAIPSVSVERVDDAVKEAPSDNFEDNDFNGSQQNDEFLTVSSASKRSSTEPIYDLSFEESSWFSEAAHSTVNDVNVEDDRNNESSLFGHDDTVSYESGHNSFAKETSKNELGNTFNADNDEGGARNTSNNSLNNSNFVTVGVSDNSEKNDSVSPENGLESNEANYSPKIVSNISQDCDSATEDNFRELFDDFHLNSGYISSEEIPPNYSLNESQDNPSPFDSSQPGDKEQNVADDSFRDQTFNGDFGNDESELIYPLEDSLERDNNAAQNSIMNLSIMTLGDSTFNGTIALNDTPVSTSGFNETIVIDSESSPKTPALPKRTRNQNAFSRQQNPIERFEDEGEESFVSEDDPNESVYDPRNDKTSRAKHWNLDRSFSESDGEIPSAAWESPHPGANTRCYCKNNCRKDTCGCRKKGIRCNYNCHRRIDCYNHKKKVC